MTRLRKPVRIVLDTNVFVSALISRNGLPGRVLEAVKHQGLTLVTSTVQLDELRTVLSRERLGPYIRREEADDLIRNLEAVGEVVTTDLPDVEVSPDPDDNRILGTAIAGRADSDHLRRQETHVGPWPGGEHPDRQRGRRSRPVAGRRRRLGSCGTPECGAARPAVRGILAPRSSWAQRVPPAEPWESVEVRIGRNHRAPVLDCDGCMLGVGDQFPGGIGITAQSFEDGHVIGTGSDDAGRGPLCECRDEAEYLVKGRRRNKDTGVGDHPDEARQRQDRQCEGLRARRQPADPVRVLRVVPDRISTGAYTSTLTSGSSIADQDRR